MFERGRGDKAATQGPIAVAITLEDGREFKGRVLIPVGQGLTDVLNGNSRFVEFEPINGGRMFIAKSALQSVKPIDVPAAPKLWAGPTQGGDFNPFAILGIKPGSTREQAHEAYITLAKIYHPDRYAATELPREVRDYLAVMARRVNAAYEALETEAKPEPVFAKSSQS